MNVSDALREQENCSSLALKLHPVIAKAKEHGNVVTLNVDDVEQLMVYIGNYRRFLMRIPTVVEGMEWEH